MVTEASKNDILEYVRILEIHRAFVYAIGKTIYPEYDFVAHDLSKFSDEELIPYTLKFVTKVPDAENPGWESALDHHYKSNPHHPQYWREKSMPEEYLKESIVDMIAAKYQYRTPSETLPPHLTSDMLDIHASYLDRYTSDDRQKVVQELVRLKSVDWSQIALRPATFSKLK